ncbi:MAG: hypothetical protein II532_04665, partial [Bacteroidales bacterium]|nr:hypothetical protein [Bacteroidales bacterium]
MTRADYNALLRPLSIPLMAEGALMLLCLIPAVHFHDGTTLPILLSGLFTLAVGFFIYLSLARTTARSTDRRIPYLIVISVWVVLTLFGMLPFLATGAVHRPVDAL